MDDSLSSAPSANGRNSNIELLRLISMFFIIAFHATRMGCTNINEPLVVYASGITLGSWGILGVDLFLIISAWFLVDQKFKTKKIIGLLFQVFTYIVVFYIYSFFNTFNITHSVAGSFANLLKDIVSDGFLQPLWSSCYWFVTAYFFLYIMSPLLNKILGAVGKDNLAKILVLLIFVPVYAQFNTSIVCDVFYFAYVYLLVGYIKKYGLRQLEKFASIKNVILVSISILLANLILYTNGKIEAMPLRVVRFILSFTLASTGRHSMILLIDALLVFFSVLKLPVRYNKTINKMAACSLGIYLFQENSIGPNILNTFISFLKSTGFITANAIFPLEYIAIVIVVFVAGLLVESVRSILIQEPTMRWLEKKYAKGMNRIDLWMELP
ncbi:MAG: acyltransferase [Eubacteriales bacterium]|nr:acyltransferase [Eubacteriales bacterium]